MDPKITKMKAAQALASEAGLQEFATLNNMALEAARTLLEILANQPTASENVEGFIFGDEAAPELKGYVSGEEKGYARGHQSGFAKGSALGVLGTVAITALVVGTIVLKYK